MTRVAAAALAAAVVAAAPAFAGNIAYVDYARLIRSAPQTAASRRVVQKEFAPSRKAMKEQRAKVKKLHQAYLALGPETNSLERAAAVENLRHARTVLANAEKRYEANLRLRVSGLQASFSNLVQKEVAAYAHAHNIAVVLREGVSFAAPDADITDAILERLKQDYHKAQSQAEKQ